MLCKPASVAVTSRLQPGLLKSLVCSSNVFMFQRPDGSFLLGETGPGTDAEADGAWQFGKGLLREAQRLLPELRAAQVESVHTGYRPWPLDGYPVVGHCLRPTLPASHHQLDVGPAAQEAAQHVGGSSSSSGGTRSAQGEAYQGCEGLWVAVTHSGMTLGPLLGRLLADELCHHYDASKSPAEQNGDAGNAGADLGLHASWLAPYRPWRGFGERQDTAYGAWLHKKV
ncbi:hypothetical protein V8C86DRAFT_2853600 [Haematococcus lacustris]